MQLSFVTIVAVASMLTTPIAALSYEGFGNTVSCSGSAFGCNDGGAVCCSLPTGFGFSVQFDNLPSGTQGQGYTGGGCSSFLFSVFGPGTKCWNGGGDRATHMNWFHSPQRAQRDLDARAEPAANCSAPAYFKYEDHTGEARTIKVPTGDANAADTIAQLHANKAYESLALYEDY